MGLELIPPVDPESFPARERRWLEFSEEEAQALLVDWFYSNFEDPAQHTSYDGREGGYQYAWGPFDAREAFSERFGHLVSSGVIDAAVDEVEQDGVEWAPHEHRLVPDGEDESSVVSLLPEEQARIDVADRLAALEAAIGPVLQRGIGDNHPPEPIDDNPLTTEDLEALQTSIAGTRQQLASSQPQISELQRFTGMLAAVAKKLGVWLALKADRAVDRTIDVGIPILVASMTPSSHTAIEKIFITAGEAASSIVTWISAIASASF